MSLIFENLRNGETIKALLIIVNKGEIYQKELTSMMQASQSTVALRTKGLQVAGLIKKVRDENKVICMPTELGKKVVDFILETFGREA